MSKDVCEICGRKARRYNRVMIEYGKRGVERQTVEAVRCGYHARASAHEWYEVVVVG